MRHSATYYWHACDIRGCNAVSVSCSSPTDAAVKARSCGWLITADYELCLDHKGVTAEEAVAAGKQARIDGAEADCG